MVPVHTKTCSTTTTFIGVWHFVFQSRLKDILGEMLSLFQRFNCSFVALGGRYGALFPPVLWPFGWTSFPPEESIFLSDSSSRDLFSMPMPSNSLVISLTPRSSGPECSTTVTLVLLEHWLASFLALLARSRLSRPPNAFGARVPLLTSLEQLIGSSWVLTPLISRTLTLLVSSKGVKPGRTFTTRRTEPSERCEPPTTLFPVSSKWTPAVDLWASWTILHCPLCCGWWLAHCQLCELVC